MTRIDTRMAFGLLALSLGLVHCSAEPAPALEGESGARPSAAGATGGGGLGSTAGGATATAGSSTTAGAGGVSGSGVGTSGSGGMRAQGGGGTGSGGTSGGANDSCAGDAIVCEDFEQYPVASAPAGGWTPSVRGDGKVVIDATRAFSGKQSLHVNGRMNADRANISRPIQTESATAYARFMMYATSYPASSGVHTRLMRIGTMQAASGSPDSSYSLAAYNGVAIEKVNSIYLRDTGTKFNDPRLLNRWTCWEFGIDRSGGIGKVKVQIWVDGRELTLSAAGSSSHGMTSPSWDPIPFELFMLGLDGFQADSQPADLWIDDLSVTSQRVGCKTAE